MELIISLLIIITVAGLAISVCIPRRKEAAIFWVAIVTVSSHLLATVSVTVANLLLGHGDVFVHGVPLYENAQFEFSFALFMDRLSTVYALVADLITFNVLIFSRYYMHRESGYKRFFNNILFFYLGLNLVILAGNFETLFAGWEILGISSFLLIGFYRDRYLPVKNSLKVVSLYRLSDVMLLVGIWLFHQLLPEKMNFHDLSTRPELIETARNASGYFALIPAFFLVVAAIKSAQFPFSSWLPRAMEGPTTSSAIFYGSLSVHIGLFLTLRLYPLWENVLAIKVAMITLGLLTSVVSTYIARVQSTIKTQIAYSSTAQIGLMFIEAALGLHTLVLFHFAGNAFLRTYQLLVSPSVLNYLIHDQYFHFDPPKDKIPNNLFGRIKSTIFVLSIKEWNMDNFQFGFLWLPFKIIGRLFNFFRKSWVNVALLLLFIAGLLTLVFETGDMASVNKILTHIFALIGFIIITFAFTERKMAKRAWLFLSASQFFFALAVAFNDSFSPGQAMLYLSGDVVCASIGFYCIHRLEHTEGKADLQNFYGHMYEHPRLGLVFLLSCLGMVGFPLTPSFIGVDLLFSHIHISDVGLLVVMAAGFIVLEIAALRIYARLFLGPHEKTYHETAFRNS